MALDGNQMGDAVADFILAQAGAALSAEEQGLVRTFWRGICSAIVTHITANGHALSGTFKDSLGGALTGKGDIEYKVLSNGEKFRADLARVLCQAPKKVVIDEFSSVVDRQIAKFGALAFVKS